MNQPKVSAAKASTAAAHNERALFEAWVRREWPSAPLHRVRDALPVNDPRYGEYCNEILQRGWVGWQARAALAQPSPAGEFGDAYQGAREDLAIWKRRALEAEQALREEKILTERLGNALNDDNGPTFMGEPNVAQPSPAPELERPEVVGRRCTPSAEMAAVQAYRKEPWVDDRITEQPSLPGFYSVEPLMTVAQHERIVESLQAEVLSWRETVRFNESCWAEERGVMIDKIQTIRGGIPLAIAAIEDGAVMITGIEDRLFKALSEHTHWKRKTASLELYAAPVAQAGQVLEGMRLVPFNPTQDQWGGLARAIVFWMRSYPSNKHTPATLVEFITSLGHEVPEWMGDEAELRAQEHVISKGTIAVLIYKAMLAAAPAQGGM
ncbi:hypothetical protein [Pseudomonas sp.]|uniref:hypothetical protein n=1 Tax=Pseudomonas sp. TaxID=306 RepID=UPI0029068133|nr:hypothetical protein [Pseudomonas sp.]MDU4251423.1 hypothetical protein [Pseudomonas sp.]